MKGITHYLGRIFAIALVCIGNASALEEADSVGPPETEIVISVAEQRLALLKEGALLKKYPVSTSKFGLGDGWGSYKTPVGHHRVYEKIGDDLALGAVMKRRHATGEILPVNAPGRDPIVTRILWLEGLEAQNRNAKSRGIYIHGTVEEDRIGNPVSYGCIRMRSRDVSELFDEVPQGTPVNIVAGKLPRLRKSAPAKPDIILASNERVQPTVGTHGLVTMKTTRSASAMDAGKPTAIDARHALFGEEDSAKGRSSNRAAWLAKVETERSAQVSSSAEAHGASPPIRRRLLGRTGKQATADDNNWQAMAGSIMDSGLPEESDVRAAKEPVENDSAAANDSDLIHLALLTEAEVPDLLLAMVNARPRELPLDDLTRRLLYPPIPQFRLAFRATGSLAH